AVARKIDQGKAVGVDPVEIDGTRLARRRADFGKLLAAGEGVDEGRLPHIGTPGKRNLRFLTLLKHGKLLLKLRLIERRRLKGQRGGSLFHHAGTSGVC